MGKVLRKKIYILHPISHPHPGRSLFINSLTNSCIYCTGIRYLVCAGTFWCLNGIRHRKLLTTGWTVMSFTEIRVRAVVWVGNTSIPFWTCYNSNTYSPPPNFSNKKTNFQWMPKITWLPGDGSGTGTQVPLIPEPSSLLSTPQPGCTRCWVEPVPARPPPAKRPPLCH